MLTQTSHLYHQKGGVGTFTEMGAYSRQYGTYISYTIPRPLLISTTYCAVSRCFLWVSTSYISLLVDVLFPFDAEEALTYLQLFGHKWRDIGRALGLPEELLEEIQRGNRVEQLGALIHGWVKLYRLYPCWGNLVKVLQHLQLEQTASRIISAHSKWITVGVMVF